jgi:3-hydroxyisobutyrate dehydrogenase
MGKTIVYHGESGSGQHAKMVNQTLIAGTMIGMCEAMIYASRAGLDIENVLVSVQHGAAGSWSLSNLAPRIINNDFKPGFMIDHFLKDLKISLEECERMSINLPGISLAKQLYANAVANGYGSKGTHALYLSMNDTQLTK